MTDSNQQGALAVQTVDGAGKAPKRRIPTPATAQGAYYSMRMMERQRDARFGDIRGIYDGFPPTPPSQMQEMGFPDMPNVNLKQFQSKIDQYVDTWRRVTTSGDVWFEVKAFHQDPREAARRSKYLTLCFNRAISRWDSDDFRQSGKYVLRCNARDTQLGLFGIGIAHFPDCIDWRWTVRPTRKVLVPFKTLVTLENCPQMFIEDDTISVTQLYSMRDKKGWNKEAVLYALYLRTNQTQQPGLGRAFTYSEWENWLRNNESWLWYTEFNPVRVIHCYTQEFTDNANAGSITHTIFIDTQATGGGVLNDADGASKDAKKTGWLYEKEKAATKWSEVVAVFSDNAGPEMEYHGVKGFGDLTYDLCHFNNLMFNKTATAGIISNMVMFTGANEVNRQQLNQVTIANGAILFPDLGQIQQMKIATDIRGAADVFTLGVQTLDQISRTNPLNQQLGPEKTATQENYERMAQTELSSLQIANYNATGNDALGGEMYRRIAQPASKYPENYPGGNVAKLFRQEAQIFGIPEGELLHIESVKATRKGGSGSMAIDIQKWKEAMAVATPGAGQLFCREQIAMSMFPPDVAAQIVQVEEPPPDSEDSTINLENLCIQNGQMPEAFGYQPHEKHLRQPSGNDHLTVLAGLEKYVNTFLQVGIQPEQMQDAVKLHNAFDGGIGHCEQHVAFMEQMPRMGARPSIYEGFIKEMRPVLNNMRQLSRSFAQVIAKAQQEAQAQPQNMSAMEQETQAKIARDNALAEAEIARKDRAADAKLGNMAIQQQVRSDMKQNDADQKLALDAQQKAFDLQSQRAQTIQQLNEQEQKANLDLVTTAASNAQKLKDEADKSQEQPSTKQ